MAATGRTRERVKWDLPEGVTVEEICQRLTSLLAVELSADRVLVLHDDQGNQDFQIVSHRKLNVDRVWTGEELDLELLRNTVQASTVQLGRAGGRFQLCYPVVHGGHTVLVAYADRPEAEEEFSSEELERLDQFAEQAAQRLPVPAAQPSVPVEAPVVAAVVKAEEAARPAGRTLASSGLVAGRFAILEPLMECRFSTLLYGLDRAHQLPVVLRRLESEGAPNREARMQLLREGRFLSRLQHRNLPRVQEIVEDNGNVYLVLEEFEGATLEKMAEQHPDGLSHEVLRRYLEQFLDVLNFLHSQDPPIIHRDMRPDSVLVTKHGVIKLAEFGLARMLESATDPRQTSFRSLGNPFYAAPEQLMGDRSMPAHDLYSVGAILYRLASGKQPPKAVERMMGAASAESLPVLRPDLDPELVGWIEKLMHADLEHRFASVAEVREAMNASVAVDLEEAAAPVAFEEEVPADPSAAPSTPAATSGIGSPAASPLLDAPPKPAARPAAPAAKKKSGLGGLADKFSAWNFLLGKKKPVPDVVIFEGEQEIVEFKSDLMGSGDVDLTQLNLLPDIGQLLPEAVARSIQGVAYELNGEELSVACKDPTEVHIYDHIALSTGSKYRPLLKKADRAQIDLAMEFIYRRAAGADQTPWAEWLERKQFETEELMVANPMAEVSYGADEITSPVIAKVDKLVKEAISVGASDIHMEQYDLGLDLRYRIDGQLHQINRYDSLDASAMVKRLKVMANMDIAQERVTQGGRISLKIGGQEFDLRVSVVPVPAGESVVMRILKKGAFNLTLSDLGFQKHTLEQFGTILSQPYGMILVCGPTGSGKSTTLYASLKQIQRPDRKLLTVEDPIEYQMAGICQVQVNIAPREDDKKVTFAKVLREFLRQDPDVILVGEIRDTETAAIAVQAALTGHLLLSTIHTNDSVGIVARLLDMSVEPFLIGSTLLGGLAQRLARRLCKDCTQEVPVSDEVRRAFEEEGMTTIPREFKGMGCKRCHGTGYRGRVGLYELMEVTPEIRNLINRRALEEEIRAAVMATGFRTLYHDGLDKVAQGSVSLEEVQRVCKTI